MSRMRKNNDAPRIKPVKNIEVPEMSEKSRKWRLIAIVLLLAVGVTLITFAVIQAFKTPGGWKTIQGSTNVEESCASEFAFLYLLGENGKAANLEEQELTQLYTQATKDAFQIFNTNTVFEGICNVAWLNQHPNEEAEVPAALYQAFEKFERYQNRGLYLAPIYREYISLCLSDEDWIAQGFDPEQNPEQKAYFEELMQFIADESAVKLVLLGNNRVRLDVSEAYMQYAAGKEITAFIDFYWMKNAFIADYLADTMINAGYTKGAISSFDGFCRNMDTSEETYQINLFDRMDTEIYNVGSLSYSGVKSLVSLRNYPMNNLDIHLYYHWEDRHFTSCHIDPATGENKTALNDLLGYSRSMSCAEVLLELFPVYISDYAGKEEMKALQEKGVETVYCWDFLVYTSEADAVVTGLFNKAGIRYSLAEKEQELM